MKTQITTSAYMEILRTVGSTTSEAGGLLFGRRSDYVVTKFLYDADAKTTKTTYAFNVGYLNPMIDILAEEGLELLGFLHSHPANVKELSEPDKAYFLSQFENIDVDKFLTPLVFPATDGIYDFVPFIVHKDGIIEPSELELLPDTYDTSITTGRDPNLVPEKTTLESQFPLESYIVFLQIIFLSGVLLFCLGVLAIVLHHIFHFYNH